MAKPALIETLQRIAEPIVTSKGLEIWGIDLIQGTRPLVRVYVDVPFEETPQKEEHTGLHDKEEQGATPEQDLRALSATVEQCAEISRMIGLTMEVEEIFASAYILEVSTPGFSRLFFHIEQMRGFVGDTVEISLNDFLPDCPPALHGRKKFKGTLKAVHTQTSTLELEIENNVKGASKEDAATQCISLHWDSVRRASRVHVFTMPEKPGKKRKTEK